MQGFLSIRFPTTKMARDYFDVVKDDPALQHEKIEWHYQSWNRVDLQYPSLEDAEYIAEELEKILKRASKKVRYKVSLQKYIRVEYRKYNETTGLWEKRITNTK
jgi:hypothetical protein